VEGPPTREMSVKEKPKMVSRQMFADILSLIARLRAPPASA
jgi:hypothetical protein